MTTSRPAMSPPMTANGTHPAHSAAIDCAVSAHQFRDAMSQITTPVSIITTDGPAGRSGMTCSAVCAASDTPPMIIACVHGASAANRVFKANGVLCVNSLSAAQSDLSQMFASSRGIPMEERFAHDAWCTLATGSPYHRNALVALDCEVLDIREAGTHSVFFCKVLAAGFGEPVEPLVYHRRAYATTRHI